MIRRPPRSTLTDTLFPYTTLFRSELPSEAFARRIAFPNADRGAGIRLPVHIPVEFICLVFRRAPARVGQGGGGLSVDIQDDQQMGLALAIELAKYGAVVLAVDALPPARALHRSRMKRRRWRASDYDRKNGV